MPAFEGGAAQPVTVDTTGGKRQAGAAVPVYVVSGGPQIAGPARRVVPVLDGPIASQAAMPVYVAEPGGVVTDEPAQPVYVVSGLLDPLSALIYTNKVKALAPANLIAYWPQAEKIGAVAYDESGHDYHGTYNAVTLNVPGIGDGRTAASFDGAASYNNIYSAGFAAGFNKSEGTAALWLRIPSAGIWSDGVARRALTLQATAQNRVILARGTTNNQLQVFYIAGATTESVNIATSGQLTWLHLAITWSKAADQVKAYFNGAQSGATQTTLGTWAGDLTSNGTYVGSAALAPLSVWSGHLAHVAVWNTPLSAAQIAALTVVP